MQKQKNAASGLKNSAMNGWRNGAKRNKEVMNKVFWKDIKAARMKEGEEEKVWQTAQHLWLYRYKHS